MSTQIKRLYQNNQEFVPITLAEAVVVDATNIPGLQTLRITTLDKVLKNTLAVVGANTLNIETINTTLTNINTTLQKKQDKLTAGDGITIDLDGTISVTNTSTLGFQYKIVKRLPSPPGKDYENIIYLVPNTTGVNGNIFIEYICINKDSIIDKINTGFSCDNVLHKDCPKPQWHQHLCKENFLGEFKTELEKQLARDNLDIYSKVQIDEFIKNLTGVDLSSYITKDYFNEAIQDLDYVKSSLKSNIDYNIPENLFTI